MVLVLGVSSGASGARAILAHSDQPHRTPIDRCVVPRRPGACVGEPVRWAIETMCKAAVQRGELITAIAVTYRSEVHADAIRATGITQGPTPTILVKESTAQLRYLRFIGELPKSGSVVLYDLGSSGLTITLADCVSGTVLRSRRSTVLGGDEYDGQVQRRLAHSGIHADTATCRGYKESLSAKKVATVSNKGGGNRIVLTRNDLAILQQPGIHHSVSFVRQLMDDATTPPEAIELLGGPAHNPLVKDWLESSLRIPVLVERDPELVSARGAVVLADEGPARLIRASRGLPRPRPSRRKLVAAFAVTAVLTGTIAGLVVTAEQAADPNQGGSTPSTFEIARIPDNPW
ncbi:hypothetical protein [Antrihabitans sp. YC2-6]|uniref:hypothetical protein n=1 Tax=Antrihabitans sp. YC2-6 TaxID=2799498 RepID=UPI0018F4579A|nr:hypothetical protein [Antrihabitans sp. YC2-6]MBJ8348117.1 hypothetical protein [Antrihabitans sp. YC2-6]